MATRYNKEEHFTFFCKIGQPTLFLIRIEKEMKLVLLATESWHGICAPTLTRQIGVGVGV
jgi:hypothetical protein